MGVHDVAVYSMVLKKKIYDVEVQAVGISDIMSPTEKKRKLTDEEKKEKNNFLIMLKVIHNQ